MKKISFLLVLLMLLSLFAVNVAADDNAVKLSVDATKADNKVNLVISIGENSNIAGCSFNIVYDSKKLTYESHEVKETISSILNIVNPEYNDNAIRVSWADVNNLTRGGQVISVVFDIKDGATGSTEIVIDKLKMMDNSSNKVECVAENPTVILSGTSSSSSSSTGGGSIGGVSSNKKPEASVTEKEDVTLEETKEEPSQTTEEVNVSFTDVNTDDWFFGAVGFVSSRNLMGGVGEGSFAPKNNLTRAMLVTILYRLEGEPECEAFGFSDVESGKWYSNGISWAAQNKVVNGVGNNMFAPDTNITREQIAVIMYNYSLLKSKDVSKLGNVDAFSDSESISHWAVDAVKWAVGNGLLSGKGDGILDPAGNATRAEIATILQRYVEATK